MPSEDQVYAFLLEHYRADRFTGRDDDTWGRDYSRRITRNRIQDLQEQGYSLVSHHDSTSGRAVFFDRRLVPIPVD